MTHATTKTSAAGDAAALAPKPDRAAVLDWIEREVPPTIAAELDGKLDTCVLSTRTGYDIARYFGIDAKPVVVRTIAYNREWLEFAETRGLTTLDGDEWEEAWETGAWAIGIDEEDRNERGRFAGHLILLCPGGETCSNFLDLSSGQFRRVEHGMNFPDAVHLTVKDSFLDEDEPVGYECEDGSGILYKYRPGVTSFYKGGDWKRHNPISGQLIRRAREELA